MARSAPPAGGRAADARGVSPTAAARARPGASTRPHARGAGIGVPHARLLRAGSLPLGQPRGAAIAAGTRRARRPGLLRCAARPQRGLRGRQGDGAATGPAAAWAHHHHRRRVRRPPGRRAGSRPGGGAQRIPRGERNPADRRAARRRAPGAGDAARFLPSAQRDERPPGAAGAARRSGRLRRGPRGRPVLRIGRDVLHAAAPRQPAGSRPQTRRHRGRSSWRSIPAACASCRPASGGGAAGCARRISRTCSPPPRPGRRCPTAYVDRCRSGGRRCPPVSPRSAAGSPRSPGDCRSAGEGPPGTPAGGPPDRSLWDDLSGRPASRTTRPARRTPPRVDRQHHPWPGAWRSASEQEDEEQDRDDERGDGDNASAHGSSWPTGPPGGCPHGGDHSLGPLIHG